MVAACAADLKTTMLLNLSGNNIVYYSRYFSCNFFGQNRLKYGKINGERKKVWLRARQTPTPPSSEHPTAKTTI